MGLYSEETGLSGGHISTCPQTFRHLALVDAAVPLDEAFDGQAPALHRPCLASPPDPGGL